MLRAASIALLALAFVIPSAAASEPLAGAGLGPGATLVTGPEAPPKYYFYAIVSPPEAPHGAGSDADCFKPKDPRQQQPPTLEQAIALQIEKVRSWDPTQAPRISPWFPTCFVGTFQNPLVRGRVSYDFPTGRYYIEIHADKVPVDVGLPPGTGAPPLGLNASARTDPGSTTSSNASAGAVVTGTTGAGTMADCEACPPPTGI